MLLFPPIPVKASCFVVGYGAVEPVAGVGGAVAAVAYFAHLGGMPTGFLPCGSGG
jgi:membrane associated rhomboid family serine protease